MLAGLSIAIVVTITYIAVKKRFYIGSRNAIHKH